RDSGSVVTITITAGSSGATLTGLQLRADLVSVDNTTVKSNTLDTTTSMTAYGVQTYTLPTRAEISPNDAQDFCNAIVSRYQNPRPIVTITLKGDDADRLEQMRRRQISDRVTIVEAQTALDADFFVESIKHQIGATGARAVQFGCEKAVDEQFWILGDATLSLLGETTYLGY
ncbi:MAG: hypothetical protein ABIH03_11680, partial [Pseudomonadota bacterium]